MDNIGVIFATLVYLFIGLLPLWWGPHIAKKKNRSTIKAFFLSLVLGYLGVIIIAFLEAKKYCKHCNARIPANNFICGVCGKKQK